MSFRQRLQWIWDHTLNSVPFGICVMAALAIYIAVGSGIPAVREFFEVNEQGFFNAWPMWGLALLLCATLLVVTFERIPFTPPRYGVWTIHMGIVLLIFGMVYYFKHKTEGLALVRVGQRVSTYHDAYERALFFRVGQRQGIQIRLPELPRFKPYAEHLGNAGRLDDSLSGLMPRVVDYNEETRQGEPTPLHEVLGLPGETPITADIVAYYPYAVAGATYEEGSGGKPGMRLTLRDPASGETDVQWIVSGDSGQDEVSVGTLRLRHVHRSDELTGEALLQAARTAHAVDWKVGEASGEVAIEPGQRLKLGDTGYEIEAVEFLPSFPMAGTGEPVDTLELLVHAPAGSPHGKTFRRYVLNGLPIQTDFVLDVDGAGPKGQRQTEPVDRDLVLRYVHGDGLHLAPHAGETERHTFLTKADTPGLWQILTFTDRPAELAYKEDGRLPIRIDGSMPDPHTGQPRPVSVELDVERIDSVVRQEWVREVPPEQRDRQAGEAGAMQVVTVRLSRGQEWVRFVQVPFTQWIDQQAWSLGEVDIPGSDASVQLQLGNTKKSIPAMVQLDEFELVPYAGDFTAQSAMRDFKSHLTLIDSATGAETRATAHMNSPVYFDAPVAGGLLGKIWPSESWLLYQNQWDPEGQAFTVLGVGNRPGVATMTVACVMIVTGLLWAFYLKPVIIRRAKERALRQYAAMGGALSRPLRRPGPDQRVGELEGVAL